MNKKMDLLCGPIDGSLNSIASRGCLFGTTLIMALSGHYPAGLVLNQV